MLCWSEPLSSNPLAKKLGIFVDLQLDDLDVIGEWSADRRTLPARHTFIRQGDRPRATCLMLEGWGYRYKTLRNGKRQVLGFLLPGDMCDRHAFILDRADHDIVMLTEAVVASITKDQILSAVETHPRLTSALWWTTLVDEGIARAWLVNLGQRSAIARVASLFCELWLRADMIGLTKNDGFALPVTQEQLGEAVGITTVHVNRMLRELRDLGLVEFSNKQAVIPDVGQLMTLADFDPTYLQLQRRASASI